MPDLCHALREALTVCWTSQYIEEMEQLPDYLKQNPKVMKEIEKKLIEAAERA